jgi:hypothetical protein
MCHVVIGKVAFALELKCLKLGCARARTNKRAYNKNVKKLQFFEKYQNGFGEVLLQSGTLEDIKTEIIVNYQT